MDRSGEAALTSSFSSSIYLNSFFVMFLHFLVRPKSTLILRQNKMTWLLHFRASVLISNSGIAMFINVSLIFTIMDALWSLSKGDGFPFPIFLTHINW